MPLTLHKAGKVYQAAENINFNEELSKAEILWNELQTKELELVPNYQSLQEKLINLRVANLNRRSVKVDLVFDEQETKVVRFYPPTDETKPDISDLFARGLDFARAAAAILEYNNHSNIGLNEFPLELTQLINQFQKNINNCGNIDKAIKELGRFNGALANLLIQKNAVPNFSAAKKSINFMRDLLWKKDLCTDFCVIEQKEGNQTKRLRYAEPLKFADIGKTDFQSTEGTINLWQGKQPWKNALAKAIGCTNKHPWFKNFMNVQANREMVEQLSSTPMTRYTPNPANAFDCTDMIIKDKQIQSLGSHLRTAITEPLNVGTTDSKQAITDWNHLQMICKERLEPALNSFLEQWGVLNQDKYIWDKDEPIPLTILHQTLTSDEVPFSPDQRKAERSFWHYLFSNSLSVIDSKAEANASVRKFLKRTQVSRDPHTGKIAFTINGQPLPEGHQLVKIKLRETNTCINMNSELVRLRNNDLGHARKLIKDAIKFYEAAKPEKGSKDLDILIQFLNSSNHSLFTPNKFRGKEVKDALKRLTLELKKDKSDDFPHLSAHSRRNLGLSLQAAVELKCVVHETWTGSFRRIVGNFTRDYIRPFPILGQVIDLAIRSTMGLISFIVKPIASLIMKHTNDREEISKAAYEGLLAETIGVLQGGCMSALDRAGEMAEQRAALREQFIEREDGKIISFNNKPKEKKAFHASYGSTVAKHHYAEMATGTPATHDKESRGLWAVWFGIFSVNLMSEQNETKEQQELWEKMTNTRKGHYQNVKVKNYLAIEPVNSEDLKIQKHQDEYHEVAQLEPQFKYEAPIMGF